MEHIQYDLRAWFFSTTWPLKTLSLSMMCQGVMSSSLGSSHTAPYRNPAMITAVLCGWVTTCESAFLLIRVSASVEELVRK